MAQAAVAVASVRHSPWPRLSSIFSSGKHPQHIFFSVARALKPLAPQALEGDGDGEPDAPAVKKSRNELKREARRAVKWGMELASFSNPQIKRVLRAADISSGVDEQLWSMAGFMASLRAIERRRCCALDDGIRSGDRAVEEPRRARRVVGPSLGPHPLRHRLLRQVQLPNRGLRVWQGGVLRRRRHTAGLAGGVHPGRWRRRRDGLPRREPGGRLQLADAGGAAGGEGGGGGGGGDCGSTGCVADLNGVCPSDLKVVAARSSSRGSEGVACMSACEAFGSPQYCCSGAYGNPNTCMPSSFSQFFKNACPKAYSYAFDDATSTFTCASADYRITFCPITAR
ncbi:hypothetical protein BHE74_00034806 [Ensete ventricosum]|nr:hypothetical protein BHE74_00034806 [Ensete ventricosum]